MIMQLKACYIGNFVCNNYFEFKRFRFEYLLYCFMLVRIENQKLVKKKKYKNNKFSLTGSIKCVVHGKTLQE